MTCERNALGGPNNPRVRMSLKRKLIRYVGLPLGVVLLLLGGEVARPAGRTREWIAWYRLRSSADFAAAMELAGTRDGIIRLDKFAADEAEPAQARCAALVALENHLQLYGMSFYSSGLDSKEKQVRAGAAGLIELLASQYWVMVRGLGAAIIAREREGDEAWAQIYYRLQEKCTLGSERFQDIADSTSRVRGVRQWMFEIGRWHEEHEQHVFPNPLNYETLPEVKTSDPEPEEPSA